MKFTKASMILAAVLSASISTSWAAEKQDVSAPQNTATKQVNPWIDCGIGAMIFPRTQVGAVISNVIWDLGTTAVTSAISSKQTCAGSNVVAARFINQTYTSLEQQTAIGKGSHLSAMLDIYGCDTVAQQQIINSIRVEFGQDVGAADYENKTLQQKAQAYYFMVNDQVSNQFKGQCHTI